MELEPYGTVHISTAAELHGASVLTLSATVNCKPIVSSNPDRLQLVVTAKVQDASCVSMCYETLQ